MKYLRNLSNHNNYTTFIVGADFAEIQIEKNAVVSYCRAEDHVHYNPYVQETRVVTKYNVTDTSSPTSLRTSYESNIFKSMEIDGVMLNELVTEYTFDTIGVHTVKYELCDETKLGNNAPVFYTSNLIEYVIPDSVTSIGNNTFVNCTGLTSITIPDSVTSIGAGVFSGCSSLISINIPDSVTIIGNNLFGGTNALKVLNYNAKCGLGVYLKAGTNWSNLETVIIGDSTPTIGDNVFSDCTSLTSVTIGDSVISIGDNAFNNCRSLTNIISNTTIAPTIQSQTFKDVKIGGILTVPVGSTGYDVWMGTADYYLGKYGWTKVEQ